MEILETLVVRAQQGNQDAYAGIVHRFQDRAVGYGYARLGDFHLAEDAAQEAFLHAFQDLWQLRDPAAFPGWFRRIVSKHCDRLTRRKQVRTVALEDGENVEEIGRDPSELAERRALQAEVAAAISELPEPQRVVVSLFYIGDHSHAEIAAFLGIPLGTVKTRLHTARQHLQQRMLPVIHDNLREQRPSRDDRFAERLRRLLAASEDGQAPAVAEVLDEDPALVNALGAVHGRLYIGDVPALHVAVMHGHRDVIDLLIQRGANINLPDKSGMTALQNALDLSFMPEYDWRGMADYLIARGADVDVFAAMWLGDNERLASLLHDHPELANAQGPNGITPIALVGSVEQARLLLDHGADLHARFEGTPGVDAPSSAGLDTPLRIKARFPDDALRFLIDRAAIPLDPYLRCVLGETGEVIAAVTARSALAHAVTSDAHVLGGGIMLLHLAVQYGHKDLVRFLLDHGADVNARARGAAGYGDSGMSGSTPLHVAASSGQAEIALLLIERGADLHAVLGEQHLTPLVMAEAIYSDWIDRTEVAAVLRQHAGAVST